MPRKRVKTTVEKAKVFDGGGARRGAIQSHADVADSNEDDFEATQDKILLDGMRHDDRAGTDDAELSDEEILALPSEDQDGESASEDDESQEQPENEDDERWGRGAKDYYDADDLTDAAARKAEEQEALRIQRRELLKLNAADFKSNLHDWKAEDEETDEESEVDLSKIPQDLPQDEKLAILQARNPEFTPFANEFSNLYERLESLKLLALRKHHPHHAILEAKYNAARTYLAVLAFYFSLMASGLEHSTKMREHEIMISLIQCREAWTMLDEVLIDENLPDTIEEETDTIIPSESIVHSKKRKRTKEATKHAEPAFELALSSDDELEQAFRAMKKTPKATTSKSKKTLPDRADHIPDEIDRDDAQSRRRTLQFYASQVHNKSAKRQATQSGDQDLPYRERRKEREQRLQLEAERRKGGTTGDDLDDIETKPQEDESDVDDEYYQLIASSSAAQKAAKKDSHDSQVALIRAERSGYEIPEELIGKRAIGRQIEANKGLTTRKPKENRNARVKKRNKYEAAKKKLGSQKAIFKQPTGSYGGELSGINHRVVKSTRLDQGTSRKR